MFLPLRLNIFKKYTGEKVRSQDLDKKIAANITALRNSLKLSQRQFALRTEIDQSHINKIEKTAMSVSLNNLQKISETFNVPIKDLFNFSDQEKNTAHKEISLLLNSISEEWKHKVILALTRELKSIDSKQKSHHKTKSKKQS